VPGILDLRTVVYLDTVTGTLGFSVAPSPGHTTASVIFPLDGVTGEYALRAPTTVAPASDTAPGTNVSIGLNVSTDAVVGDSVLLDGDGDLTTTTDQALVKVVAVRYPPSASWQELVLDQVPASVGTLRRGTSVIRLLGDAFSVSGVANTAPVAAGASARPLDRHGARFAADGSIF
jgi:hypothetical protein